MNVSAAVSASPVLGAVNHRFSVGAWEKIGAEGGIAGAVVSDFITATDARMPGGIADIDAHCRAIDPAYDAEGWEPFTISRGTDDPAPTEGPFVPMGEFDIPDENLPKLEKKIAALAKKAARLGQAPVMLAYGGTVVREVRYTAYDVEGEPYEARGKFSYTRVRVLGPEPRLNGWTLAAVLERADEGTIIRNVPGTELPSAYQTADPTYCAHCGKRRARAETFVLRHDDGSYMQVGRQCLRDFLGGNDPQTIAAYAAEIHRAALWGETFGGRGRPVFATDEYLAYVVGSVRHRGRFVSRAEAGYGSPSTADDAGWNLRVALGIVRRDPKHDPEPWKASAEDAATAVAMRAEVLTALTAKAVRSDFESNLLVLLRGEHVKGEHFGMMAAAWSYLHREREYQLRQAERAAREATKDARVNEWAGTEGKRGDFTLTYEYARQTEGDWGTRTMIRFADAEGRCFVWWTGDFNLDELTEGATYAVRATVKRHDEYKGTKQTTLTRAIITDIPEAKTA